jgi:hypothetical protein
VTAASNFGLAMFILKSDVNFHALRASSGQRYELHSSFNFGTVVAQPYSFQVFLVKEDPAAALWSAKWSPWLSLNEINSYRSIA